MSRPGMKQIAEHYKERATKANLPYAIDRCAGLRHGRGMADPRGRR